MRAWLLGLALGLVVLTALAGCWAYALDYEGDPDPAYQPGIGLDTDRSKTRPPLKQTAPKPAPAPRKVK